MSRPVAKETVDLIKSFEGFRSHPYRDAVGVLTVGYGETQGVTSTRPVLTEPEAAKLLERRLEQDYAPSVDKLRLPLNENQRGALISFVYNLGPGYLEPGHTIGDSLRRRDWHAAADAFLLYDHAGGQRLEGLTRRRKAERALFLKPAKTHEQIKVEAWQHELAEIRRYIALKGNGWARHPIRWTRAKRLKAAITRHGGKA